MLAALLSDVAEMADPFVTSIDPRLVRAPSEIVRPGVWARILPRLIVVSPS
jgi:hypothetical protein